MGQQESHFYEFGRFRLDASERVLLRDQDLVPLTPKVFEILLALVEQGGYIVEKDDLMRKVWPDTFVEEGNLTQNVSLLRKALGEKPSGPRFIETIARRGYRFVATVSETRDAETRRSATVTMAATSTGATQPATLESSVPPVVAPERVDAHLVPAFQTVGVRPTSNGFSSAGFLLAGFMYH